MNTWYEQAVKKLTSEKNSGNYDRYASIMNDAVCEALEGFCRQDAEFAQAVVQGRAFADCMKEVAKNCGKAISDAVQVKNLLELVLAPEVPNGVETALSVLVAVILEAHILAHTSQESLDSSDLFAFPDVVAAFRQEFQVICNFHTVLLSYDFDRFDDRS